MRKFLLIVAIVTSVCVNSQDTIMPLWPKGKIPNAVKSIEKEVHEITNILRISKVQEPSIEVYLPSKSNATGKAVVIFPGGGYRILAYDWEGRDIAKFLNGKGIAGIVVKNRLPSKLSQKEMYNVPLIDAQRAIRLVRANAEKFSIAKEDIGVIGFSAGGHLASTLGTHYNEKVYESIDGVDAIHAKPNFMALIYPVISMGEYTHKGSKNNLLGDNPSVEKVAHFSNELHVTQETPATFLVHATDDKAVPVENSLLFYKALKKEGVSATLHIYPKGGHGFSLGLKDAHLSGWTELFYEWMKALE